MPAMEHLDSVGASQDCGHTWAELCADAEAKP